jgi:hypothetical protein
LSTFYLPGFALSVVYTSSLTFASVTVFAARLFLKLVDSFASILKALAMSALPSSSDKAAPLPYRFSPSLLAAAGI